jgi:transposase
VLIIGCNLHSRFQQIAMLDLQTGEVIERRLEHENGEAGKFHAGLATPARVGMEATGYAQWFERMLAEQGHQLWVGDAAEIRAAMVRKQKTDSRDACRILELLLRDKFPRIWIPSTGERDVRHLLRHRYKLVCLRTSLKNQLQAMAMGQGICRKKKLWTSAGRKELQGLSLGPWASHRRQQLLDMLDQLEPVMEELDRAVMREAEKRPAAVHLMTQPGVGPVTALAFVLTIGPVSRFQRSKQVVNYLGFNPSEESSGGRQRLVYDPELRRDYQRLKFRRGRGVAKVASHEVGGTAVLEAA